MNPFLLFNLSSQKMYHNTSDHYTVVSAQQEDVKLLTKLVNNLQQYYVPMVLSTGIVSNLACSLGFSMTRLSRKFYPRIYLAVNISNIGFLLSLFLTWLKEQDIDVYKAPGMCPMVIFMSHFFPFMSFWNSIMAAFFLLLQRSFVIINKFARGSAKGKICVICLFVLSLTVYLYKTWTNGLMTINGRRYCTVLPKTENAVKVLNILDIVFLLLLPFLAFLSFQVISVIRHIRVICDPALTTRPGFPKDAFRVILSHSICFVAFVGPCCISKVVLYLQGMHETGKVNVRDILLQNMFQYLFYTYFATVPIAHVIVSKSFRTYVRACLFKVKRNITPNSYLEDRQQDQTLL